ncbi:PheS-related mystery ligase SrmL [Amycolatopsis samaneae]|uniref:FDX-ACB domain-containing protein n=1 Tax=Amycolatopsis samaneae TaxID=664691 RepID=A0ABW5GQW2_9PSEU
MSALSPAQLTRDLAVRDLSDPAAGPHALQLVVDLAVGALAARWDCAVRWCRGDRIVTVEDNYDNLGYDPADVTRDARYTRYVDERRMLRSHSTATVPAALRALAEDPADDVLLVCPGVVYRRDSIDRLHTGTPHQLDLWRITRGAPMDRTALHGMITALLAALLPGRPERREPRRHPYTLDGVQVDVEHGGEWVEVAECGVAHPEVLARAGLGAGWSGLALGMGLDRMLMLLKGVPDIRLLRSAEPAVLAQLGDLAPYRPVSAMPPVRRDLSIAVGADELAEDLGDRVREALGADADSVESVEILAETPCAALPERALARLGAHPGQKNLLVRIVLRSLGATLSDHEANLLRDRVYAALHRGTVAQWAAGGS